MASFDTLQALVQHPEWIAPRSDTRVFLGEPGAPEATKTTVEPGNAFSPGMRTFGVTWWLRFPQSGTFFCCENAALETLTWRFEDGYLPLLHCTTQVDDLHVRHSLFQDGTASELSEAVCGHLQLTNTADEEMSAQVFIALRSLGPAGGPVYDLAAGPEQRSLWLQRRHLPLLSVDQAPTAIGCGIGDPSSLARRGEVPDAAHTHDPAGWCFGLLRFDVHLSRAATWQVHFDCPLQTYGTLQDEIVSSAVPRPQQYEQRAAAHLARWRALLGHVALEVPDQDFHDAFFAGLQHMLTATVGDQARIAPLVYPLPWLRDSIYIIRCFELAGLHELARAATEYCVRNDFFGGFGAESDAPSEGIWALTQHYRITHDTAWLEHVYPAIRRKCEWIFRMRRAEKPIQLFADTPMMAFTMTERAAGIICTAARDGIIMGSMDHRIDYARGWVNQWALGGLHEAAYAARELGFIADATAYEAEASDLKTALQAFIAKTPAFFEWERTLVNPLWPSRAWEDTPEQIEEGFNSWWHKNRGSEDDYHPEPYWLYFEFAQAHNALLLGQRERAWRSLDYRLHHQDVPGLYGWREGGPGAEQNTVRMGGMLLEHLRGCHKIDGVVPHGWSQSEMWLLQRAMLLEEWQGKLLLFAGIPATWLTPHARIAFHNLPSWYGTISAELRMDAQGQAADVTVTGVAPDIQIKLLLPSYEAEATSTGDTLTFHLALETQA